ncbi:MAG: 50S ribosomal protein L18 [Vampirovibrionia bacterium]
MITKTNRKNQVAKRRLRVRKKIFGTAERPRLAVHRSGKHIYAQLINDETGVTIASASTLDKSIRESLDTGANKKAATEVGKLVAKRAKEKGVEVVIFDRGGFLYHGRIAALADGAREEGLLF